MSRYVENVLRGQLGLSGIDNGFLSLDDARLVAHRGYAMAGTEFSGKPWELIWGLRIVPVVVPSLGICRELCDEHRIAYRHNPNPRERHVALFHGVAHVLLRREKWEHAEPDVWLVTAELAAPWDVLDRIGLETLLRRSSVPTWLIHAWADARSIYRRNDELLLNAS